jgi:hypothetical protein
MNKIKYIFALPVLLIISSIAFAGAEDYDEEDYYEETETTVTEEQETKELGSAVIPIYSEIKINYSSSAVGALKNNSGNEGSSANREENIDSQQSSANRQTNINSQQSSNNPSFGEEVATNKIEILNTSSRTNVMEQSSTAFVHMTTFMTNATLGVMSLISKIITYPLELLTSNSLPHVDNQYTHPSLSNTDVFSGTNKAKCDK